MVALVNEARLFKPWLRAAFVVNRCVVRTLIGRELRGALAEAVAQPMPVLATAVRQRIVFAEAAATGRLVEEIDEDCPAAQEIARLGDEVRAWLRSEEHTSELQSLMRISYAVFCLKKKTSQVQK